MLERATAQTMLAGKREDDPMIVRPQGSNWKEKPMQDRLFELADTLKALRERKDALEAELKRVNADIDDADFHLADLMAETETQNFTRAGTLFCLTTKTRASAQAGRRAELYAALRDKGYGDLVYETVNANSLSAFVKEQMEEQDALPDWLEGLVHVFEKTTVSVRKAR